jgi:DNA-binding HxlR family transcriptional regulator
VTDALDVVGDRYSLAIVRELFYGNRRFVELVEEVAAPRSVLTARLNDLVANGVIERRRYSERPPRDKYVLTAAGLDLAPVLLALKQWGDTWCRGGEPSAIFRHTCNANLLPRTCCATCGQPVQFDELEVVGGTSPPMIRA